MEKAPPAKLRAKLSPLGVWAFALGSSIGWGSLVVTSTTCLAEAGPWGSVLGMLLCAAIMILVSRNYAYLAEIHPDAGGAYSYVTHAFGHDYGFLTGWFLALTYLAIFWANATSIPLFMRNFVGPLFEFGRMYEIFGYDVYLGEALLTMAAILLVALLCVFRPRHIIRIMIGLVCLFSAGITAVFLIALAGGPAAAEPAFLPDTSALSQIIHIAIISPWAFIGFESVSHAAEELSFHRKKLFRYLVISVISITAIYIFITLLSVSAFPPRYGSWLEYIRDRDNLTGLEHFPAFYAARHFAGDAGVLLLLISLMALILSSLIGTLMALSRLLYRQAVDRILPAPLARLNRYGLPANVVWLLTGVSLLVPFLGRTAIGWIVDVTTICATLIYGLVAAATLKTAWKRQDRTERITGASVLALMIGFGLYLLLPSLFSPGSLEKETYFLFIVWSILGFLYFRYLLSRDTEKRFGSSAIVWMALLSLVLFVSLLWMRQSMISSNDRMLANIREYYEEAGNLEPGADELFIEEQMDQLEKSNLRTVLMSIGMFGFALAVMLTNHRAMIRRTRESETIINIDPMTGTRSKHAYLLREKEINAGITGGSMEDFAVVVCDVNGLKTINDTLGHQAGDEYICQAGRLICEVFAHSPVYRVGGDEFVVILTGRDYEQRENLRLAIHHRSVSNISTDGAVVSCGMSDFRNRDACFHDVFTRADALMYEEKALLKGLGSISRDSEPEPSEEQPAELRGIEVRKQILIAEDVQMNQLLLGAILEEKYDLLFAANGAEVLEALEDNHGSVDLLLLDLQMPVMDGMDVLRTMKADPVMRDIPVIVLTGNQGAEVECLLLGAADFIPKPYPAAEIIQARVQRCIELFENRDIIQSTERDSLTRLYNFDFFLRYVETYDRNYAEMPMDALVIDINRFQSINERHGRVFGDGVLRKLGESLRRIAREIGGLACRQSSDIFYLYCPHREDYAPLLERMSAEITDSEERIHLRMGICSKVDKNMEIEARFDRAKKAADAIGGSRVRSIGFYDEEIHRRQMYRDRLLEDFPVSLAQGCFQVYLQPKYDIRPERPKLTSAEALVRWDHPELGLISPSDFIPFLEESGLILALDSYVWRRTAERIRCWKDQYGTSIPVSVNVSRIDMLSPNLKSLLSGILADTGLAPRDLILEITESAYTGDADQIVATALELREMGFLIEMDDFGTGYSSLGALARLPIDALKLDISFVRNAFGEHQDVRMIELILDIAKYLNVPVIAEGVETEAQLLALRELGCAIAQGFYFSRPVPEAQLRIA